MGVDVVTLEDVHQLHFDCVAASVSNSTFRADSQDKVIVEFRCTLLYRADDVLANVTREPLVDGGNLTSKALELVDAHWSYF